MAATSRSGRRGSRTRVVSAARSGAAPYSTPSRQNGLASASAWDDHVVEDSSSRGSKSWPPTQINIRGSSGPTWIVIANLIKGTSADDVKATLIPYGAVAEVKERKPPSVNHPSVAFEVAFEQRSAALTVIEKLDGALADGRILQVFLPDAALPRSPAASASVAPPPQGPSASHQVGRRAGQQPPKELFATPSARGGKGGTPGVLANTGFRKVPASGRAAPAQPVQRILPSTKRVAPGSQVTRVQAGKPAPATATAPTPLSQRISMPLSMRLSSDHAGAPKSDAANLGKASARKARLVASTTVDSDATNKTRRSTTRGGRKAREKRDRQAGMEVD